MDYDGDGILDVISGCYDPGDIFLSRGLGKGKYGPFEPIRDKKGTGLVHHPEEYRRYESERTPGKAEGNDLLMLRVASFGSWPATVDWDADGDLDVLIGSFAGRLYLRTNEGTRTKPAYAATAVEVKADGSPLDVGGHCNPVVADWDADGRWDLVVGAHDGSVSWYRNIGKPGTPDFGPSQTLVDAKAKMKFVTHYLQPGESGGPGVRSQICVTDYDGDGRLDLLLGDYAKVVALRELDASEEAVLARLQQEVEDLRDEILARQTAGEAIEDLQAAYKSNFESQKQFHAEGIAEQTVSHVWLYKRKSAVDF